MDRPVDPLSVDNRYARICSAATLQSETKGFFSELVNNLEAVVGSVWVKELASLDSDDECLRFAQRRTEVRDAFRGVQPVSRPKDATMAARLSREAASALQRGEHTAALPLLNRAAVKVPPGPALGAVLWTRSGAFIAAGDWAAGRADAESALTQGLPDERRADAFVRIGRCHLALGDAPRARIALQLGKRLAGDSGDSALQAAAERALTKLETGDVTPPATPDGFLDGGVKSPFKADFGLAKGPSLPEVDEAILSVSSAPGAGRFLTAARSISPGETLLVERPVAAVPLPDRAGSRCHHCLARLEATRGCPRCSGVAFCSPACSASAEATYHKVECPFLGLLEGSGASALTVLALRLVSQKPLAFFHALRRKADATADREIDAYSKVLALEGHDRLRPPSELYHRTVMALFLLRILQQSSYFTKTSNPDAEELSSDEAMIGGYLLRLMQVLQFNAHEVVETLVPPAGIRSARPLPIAIAVYPRGSLFNHSCNPNVTRHFVGTTLVASSTRCIKQGSVAADSYGAVFNAQALGERRRWLASRYWFICSCDACKGYWPLFGDLNEDDQADAIRPQLEQARAAMDSNDMRTASAILVQLLSGTMDPDLLPTRWAIEAQKLLRACIAASGNVQRLQTNPFTGSDLTVATLAIK